MLTLTLISHRNCSGGRAQWQSKCKFCLHINNIAQQLLTRCGRSALCFAAANKLAVCKTRSAFVVSAVTGVTGTQQRCIAAFSSSERGTPKRTRERVVFFVARYAVELFTKVIRKCWVARGIERSFQNQRSNQTVVKLLFLIPLATEQHCMTQMTGSPHFIAQSGASYVWSMLAGLVMLQVAVMHTVFMSSCQIKTWYKEALRTVCSTP